jgi:hypothetical protein
MPRRCFGMTLRRMKFAKRLVRAALVQKPHTMRSGLLGLMGDVCQWVQSKDGGQARIVFRLFLVLAAAERACSTKGWAPAIKLFKESTKHY